MALGWEGGEVGVEIVVVLLVMLFGLFDVKRVGIAHFAIQEKIVIVFWNTLVFNQILDIGVVAAHLSQLIDELFLKVIKELRSVFVLLATIIRFIALLRSQLIPDFCSFCLQYLLGNDVVSFHKA